MCSTSGLVFLLRGAKTVEVRTYLLGRRQEEEHWIEDTGGNKPPRGFKNSVVGLIKFKVDFQYTSYAQLQSDELCHQIPAGSAFDWDVAKTNTLLYGWAVDYVRRLANPRPAAVIKGMIGAKL